jgi:hypothetical protein
MKRLVNTLILFTSLGCKANIWRDPNMVYGFDAVRLAWALPNHNL